VRQHGHRRGPRQKWQALPVYLRRYHRKAHPHPPLQPLGEKPQPNPARGLCHYLQRHEAAPQTGLNTILPSDTTVAGLIAAATDRLAANDIDEPLLDAQVLLVTVLGRERSFLYAHPEFTPDSQQLDRYLALIERRALSLPVAWLTGHREFWSLDLRVANTTLIPRPETEALVELCLQRIPHDAQWPLLDLGTGSGAIALALARERPGCTVTATDRIPAAIDLAADNASRLGLHNLRFVTGHWFAPLQDQRFQVIAANPPYIAADDPHLTQGDVAHEPRSALVSGHDGLDDIRAIIRDAHHHLTPGGWLLLEHGYDQGNKLLDLLRASGYDNATDYADLAGQPRVAVAQQPV
jgi:release factor glutamine methyltransferase